MKSRICFTTTLALVVCAPGLRAAPQTKNAAPTAASIDVSWQEYQDPLEQAFVLEVPKGWTVKGGMFRLGYSDHRQMIDMTSPDGKINIRVGDVAIPTYFLPNQFHHEGEVYDLGAQAQGTVSRYRTGQEFAEAYAKVRFAHVCQSLSEKPGSPPSNPPRLPNGTTMGEATYTCSGAQGERLAYSFAETQLTGGLWQVIKLASYVAPEAQFTMARDITIHATNSFQLSPEWIQKQNQYDQEALVYQRERQQARLRQLSVQVAQFEIKMQAMQNQVNAFERGQAEKQKQFQAFDNIISGITPTTDPYGNTYNVFNGPKTNYYRDPGSGRIVNADKPPGPGWDVLTPQQ
jgi:hypothetical protein